MLATSKEGQVSWKAVSEAFGAAGMIESQTAIEMNLRFPGQYFDQETNSHYNFHRDYRPNLGRYLQSDPIGLEGGVNWFSYTQANPILKIDPLGLVEWSGRTSSIGAVGIIGGILMYFDLTSECVCNKRIRLQGYASFLAAGLGAKLSGVSSASKFSDNYACPRDDVANGFAAAASIGWVTVGGASISATALGSLRSAWPPISTHVLGWDTSATVSILGWSWANALIEDCCN